jgi:hypothetical protein
MPTISQPNTTPPSAVSAAAQHLQDTFVAEGSGTFDRIALDVGLAEPAPVRDLQLLYWLRSQHPLTRSDMLQAMTAWRGTGRNEAVQFVPGGGASALLERMAKADLLWEMGAPKRFLVSPKGIALLARLHPSCEDLDLPWRLARWETMWPAAVSEVDRYVRSVVARQRSFAAPALG